LNDAASKPYVSQSLKRIAPKTLWVLYKKMLNVVEV